MRTDLSAGFEDAARVPRIPNQILDPSLSLSGKERNHLFWNRSGERFDDISAVSGLDHAGDARVSALFDFDHDGWLDVAIANSNAPKLVLFRNEIGAMGARGRSIVIELEGGNHSPEPRPGWSNRDGIGARIRVFIGDDVIVREYRAGEGFAGQNSPRILIGIGAREAVDRVEVRWPSGRVQETREVAAGTLLRFSETEEAGASGVTRTAYRPVGSFPRPLPKPATANQALLAELASGAGPNALRVFTSMASWCEACREELPQLTLLRQQFSREELSLYAVPTDSNDTREKLEAWQAKHSPDYELLIEATPEQVAGFKDTLVRQLRRDALPASIVTDARGRTLEGGWGVPTVSQIRRLRSR